MVVVELSQIFWVTTLTKIVALILGGFIVYLAYKGYKRNSSKPLLYVALGFALITAGTIAEGILYVLLGSELLSAIAAGTAVVVLGFVVIIYSIYSVK
ncbi:MAG: hypothetical protein ABSD99_04805 [Candidatus Bathyarchaeia archaeon]|jgi:hypothetical protein